MSPRTQGIDWNAMTVCNSHHLRQRSGVHNAQRGRDFSLNTAGVHAIGSQNGVTEDDAVGAQQALPIADCGIQILHQVLRQFVEGDAL